MHIASTQKANTIASNVTSTTLINCHCKKVRNCYILQTVLLAKNVLFQRVLSLHVFSVNSQ